MAALSPAGALSAARFDAIVAGAHAAQSRIREAAWREMHRDPYRPELGRRRSSPASRPTSTRSTRRS